MGNVLSLCRPVMTLVLQPSSHRSVLALDLLCSTQFCRAHINVLALMAAFNGGFTTPDSRHHFQRRVSQCPKQSCQAVQDILITGT